METAQSNIRKDKIKLDFKDGKHAAEEEKLL